MLFALKNAFCFAFITLFLFSSGVAAKTISATQSVAGYWKTFDDKTKKPSSIIQIQPQGEFFIGRVVKAFPVPGEQKSPLCIYCHDTDRNKPIIGLTIIKKMQCLGDRCHGGTILDPRNGQIYRATLRLMRAGQYLRVRGYVGLALFGKTVVWQRVTQRAMR